MKAENLSEILFNTAYGETCENTIGSYKCVCKEGFVADEMTGRYCKDLNECELDPCPINSECVNTQGSYECRCHLGFSLYNGKWKQIVTFVMIVNLQEVVKITVIVFIREEAGVNGSV